MLLLIDNYDSFTFNLVQRFGEIDPSLPIHVVRNDDITPETAMSLDPTHLVISPGPCTPREAGASAAIIDRLQGRIPILGVCLGHQTIGDLHGMVVRRNEIPVHGKTSMVHHDSQGVFAGLSDPFQATRYHSLVVDRDTVPSGWKVSAWLEDGMVMGLRRTGDGPPVEGVQFHPESFLTTEGPRLLANFLELG
ncbi:MAG: aminodeoxychorismate/anthranilate synthase component II [Phycisphaeraceae bacterium]|nr:aminodeoxychorismate/anthranilate synthase component II [Phycisphaeraceae bacterium]HAC09562.1 anthranilate/aminodeoxychorismate synthase component II [Phycisphaerales bacterium]MCP4012754.1 aminodeoxychorismate/anthranilate synthase component II [Phycisphaeraceae bacterium]MCP4068817.1 aminodeoxychorismate/anthranilate synthase component II [Phycisphaeraceae bacterium]MCP4495352.1 aminodeoxychorismate/anthranilate synthase component II [Phycisphaeraceae bacterium]